VSTVAAAAASVACSGTVAESVAFRPAGDPGVAALLARWGMARAARAGELELERPL
jgi:hypothetical protein